MKYKVEDLVRYTTPPELPVTPLSPDELERIRELTMKQIKPSRRLKRHAGMFAAAAVLLLLLCGTALAAYVNGWFDRLFGENTQMVSENIVNYPAREPQQPDSETALPEARGNVLETYTADTKDYRFTLETLLAGPETIYAVVRMDPLTEFGRQNLELDASVLSIVISNRTSQRGGSTALDCIGVENGASYFLLSDIGGENRVGDLLHFEALSIPDSDGGEYPADLFDVSVTSVVDSRKTVELDRSAYDDYNYFTTLTVTPISLTITGWFDQETFNASFVPEGGGAWHTDLPEPIQPEVSVTLTDGTTFPLEYAAPGVYGVTGEEMRVSKDGEQTNTWSFSQIVDLDKIVTINVDGVAYSLK